MEKARAHIYIDGRVQGVFYRGFTQNIALKLKLKGWVRNLRDGRVEAVFEGDKEVVEEAIRQCSIGPPASRITGIDVQWEAYNDQDKDFSVRYTV
jgi:acylphosphatase